MKEALFTSLLQNRTISLALKDLACMNDFSFIWLWLTVLTNAFIFLYLMRLKLQDIPRQRI